MMRDNKEFRIKIEDIFKKTMTKYRKEVTKKAVGTFREYNKVMYALYMLRILRLNDIILYHELYNFGATACFKLNWFNPLAWILVTVCIIFAIICSIVDSIVDSMFDVAQYIKRGIIIYFE